MKWRIVKNEQGQWVPLTDIVVAVGYSRTTIGSLREELATAPGVVVKPVKMKLARGKDAWVVHADEADAAYTYLVARRNKREYGERRVPQVDEFEATVRKLIHLCSERKIDSLTIQDGKAEIVRTVTVTKQETIKP